MIANVATPPFYIRINNIKELNQIEKALDKSGYNIYPSYGISMALHANVDQEGLAYISLREERDIEGDKDITINFFGLFEQITRDLPGQIYETDRLIVLNLNGQILPLN